MMIFKENFQRSYSQCGEDCVVNFIRNSLNLQSFLYVDIGAHHPFQLSNTAMFYKMGFRGILIEPDPHLYTVLMKKRKHDTILNCGVSPDASDGQDFYLMSPPSLNTFSKREANLYAGMGHEIVDCIRIPCVTIMDVIDTYCGNPPNFISIDCEGLDLHILKSIDLSRCRPEIICIETLEYRNDKTAEKNKEIPAYMESSGYFSFSDTYINTIFLDKDKWG